MDIRTQHAAEKAKYASIEAARAGEAGSVVNMKEVSSVIDEILENAQSMKAMI